MSWLKAVGLSLVMSATAEAQQGWNLLPNGQWGYQVSYVTSGVFSCGRYIAAGTCIAQGNILTLLSGGNTLTMTFEGASETFYAPSKVGQHNTVNLGRITKTFTGSGPFIPPHTPAPKGSYLFFDLQLTQTWPYSAINGTHNGIHARNGTFRMYGKSFMSFGPLNYQHVGGETWAYDDFEPIELTATASVSPEPATLMLIGTGLLGIGGVVRRRARSRIHSLD